MSTVAKLSRLPASIHCRYASLGALALTLVLPACGSEASGCGGTGTICSYLGNGEAGLGSDGMAPLEVSLYLPQDLSFDAAGKPYVLDWNNHRVRTIVDDHVETLIGTGYLGDAKDGPASEVALNHPTHITFDPEGRMILSAWHNSKIMRFDPETQLLTGICGDGKRDYGGDGGPAMTAVLDLPVATAFDKEQRLLIMDQANQRIRRIEDDGSINTVVGPNKDFEPVPAGYEQVCVTNPDTQVESCKLCLPAEADNPACAAKKPQSFGGDNGPGTEAFMFQPFSQSAPPAGRMEMGENGVLYFCDTGNNRVRALDEDGNVTTVAGSGPTEFDRTFKGGYEGDGGKATKALLQHPTDVAVAKSGNLYIADTFNHCIRRVTTDGIIDAVAGTCGERGFDGDGNDAKLSLLDRPYGITLFGNDLYIADTHNHRIRVVYGVEAE